MWRLLQERIEEQSTIIRLLRNYLKRIWIITVKKSQNARIVSLPRILLRKNRRNSQIYDANTYIKEYTYIGIVQDVDENGWCKIYQRNKFSVGETIEVMIPDGSNRNLKVLGMEDEDRHAVESAPHPKQEIWINFGEALEKGYLLQKE